MKLNLSRKFAVENMHMRELLKGSSVAMAVKILGTGLAFLFSLVLARFLGPEDIGLYFLALTLLIMVSTIGGAGLGNVILRHVASSAEKQDWGAIKGGVRFALGVTVAATLALAIIVFVCAGWLSVHVFAKPGLATPLRLMMLAAVPFAVASMLAEALRGFKYTSMSLAVSNVWPNVIALSLFALLIPYFHLHGAVMSYALACMGTLAIVVWRWRQVTPQLRGAKPHHDGKELMTAAAPLFWASIMTLITAWTSTLLLGVLASNADIGTFGVAERVARLTGFVLVAVNAMVTPQFAALHAKGDRKELDLLARRSTWLMNLLNLPLLIILLIFPKWIMSVCGTGFESGYLILVVLGVGRFFTVLVGSVGFLLIMTGHERLMRNNLIMCAVFCVIANAVLIPPLGALGAALATTGTLILQDLTGAYLVWSRLGIFTIPLSLWYPK